MVSSVWQSVGPRELTLIYIHQYNEDEENVQMHCVI